MINLESINENGINATQVLLIGNVEQGFTSTFTITDTVVSSLLVAITDVIAFISVADSVLVSTQFDLADTIAFQEDSAKIVTVSVTDLYEANDDVSIGRVLAAIIDSINFSDSYIAQVTVTKAFASILELNDGYQLRQRIEQDDALALVDSITWKITQLLSLIDSTEFADSYGNALTFLATVSDDLIFTDEYATIIQTIKALADSFGLIGKLRVDGTSYLVWGINPRTGGAFKLNYPMDINSFARIGGKNLLCAPSGIYEVGGDDDDGAAIEDMLLKTGFEDFDDPERHYPGEKIKQLLSAYLVMTAEGETLLKVVQTRRGTAEEVWFKCREKPSVMSKKQIPLSNSLRSILFQFEIIPLEGKKMKIREMEIVPLFLQRSI